MKKLMIILALAFIATLTTCYDSKYYEAESLRTDIEGDVYGSARFGEAIFQ